MTQAENMEIRKKIWLFIRDYPGMKVSIGLVAEKFELSYNDALYHMRVLGKNEEWLKKSRSGKNSFYWANPEKAEEEYEPPVDIKPPMMSVEQQEALIKEMPKALLVMMGYRPVR
jgi:predicted transcriptional regulator